MRTVLIAVVAILIFTAEFVVIRRFNLLGNFGPMLIFFTVVPFLVWAAKQEATARRLTLQKGAGSFGFQPVDKDDVTLSVYPLRVPGWVACAASGELRGLQAWIFDYGIQNPGSHNKTINQTVIGFRVDGANLPIFQIRPLGLGTLIDDWEKDDSVCFPDALHFHRRFELLSSAEEGVRRHFDAKLLDTIAALYNCDCIVQGFYTTVLFYTYGKTLKPDEMEAFARKGADIAYAIFSTEKRVMAAAAK